MDLPDFLHEDADGEIRLKGHRIRLIDVAARYDEGHSALPRKCVKAAVAP